MEIEKNLIKKLSIIRSKKKTIGLCHGVFDVIHPGHINHFIQARKFVDFLVVSVTEDRFVNKGPGRPVFDISKRISFLKQIKIIDMVISSPNFTGVDIINLVKPKYYFKGLEYKTNNKKKDKNLYLEIKEINKFKGQIIYTDGFSSSSSKMINSLSINQSNEKNKFIKSMKKKYSLKEIFIYLDKLYKCDPAIVGEIIIDKYSVCEAIGKSGKEPVMVIKEGTDYKILGGSGALANNLSNFCKNVSLFTYLGEKNNELNFIKNNLKKNINFFSIKKKKSNTIIKKRYIEIVNNTKILGVYNYNDNFIDEFEYKQFTKILEKNKVKNKLVIVSDFGHGLITEKLSKYITKKSKYLAVNCQLNASNVSHHSLKKYKKTDFILINESELRHELRDKENNLDQLVKKLLKIIKTKKLIITKGKEGAYLYDIVKKEKFHCPAFANSIVDKVGAGDAMFGISATCLYAKIPNDLSLFFGSLIAANNVEDYGSKFIPEVNQLKKIIKHILG